MIKTHLFSVCTGQLKNICYVGYWPQFTPLSVYSYIQLVLCICYLAEALTYVSIYTPEQLRALLKSRTLVTAGNAGIWTHNLWSYEPQVQSLNHWADHFLQNADLPYYWKLFVPEEVALETPSMNYKSIWHTSVVTCRALLKERQCIRASTMFFALQMSSHSQSCCYCHSPSAWYQKALHSDPVSPCDWGRFHHDQAFVPDASATFADQACDHQRQKADYQEEWNDREEKHFLTVLEIK